jgi:protein-disulfide isomerase
MHDCRCSDTLRQEVSVTLLNVIKSTSIDRTPFDRGDVDTCQGTRVGLTQAGYSHLGNPDAPVTLEEYSDFLCPFCSRHFEQTVPTLVELYVQTGQANYVLCDMPLVGLHPTAPIGHVATRCTAVQGTAYFWAMHVAGEAPPQEEEPEPPERPYWANAGGLAPDLDRPGFTLAGDPDKGDPESRLVMVEFTDSQCSPCGQHALEIQPALDEAFVETGDIMWVFKPLPLREHSQAPAVAVAAECAAGQGQFWEMHDLLFEGLDTWSTAVEPDPALLALAEELNLDMATAAHHTA